MAKKKVGGGLAALLVLAVAAIAAVILLVSLITTETGGTPPPRLDPERLGRPLIRIEDKVITQFHLELGRQFEGIKRGKEGYKQPDHGILRELIETAIFETILAKHGRGLTPQEISNDRARGIRESREPAKMRELIALLDQYPGMFELFQVKPALANQRIHYGLLPDKSVQAEVYAKAEAALKEALREGEDFFRRRKEEDPLTYRRTDTDNPTMGVGPAGPQQGPKRPPGEEEEMKRIIRDFANKNLSTTAEGQVCANLIEAEGGYLVVRLIERNDKRIQYDVVSYPKIPFDVWYSGELKKIKGEIVDPSVREMLIKNMGRDHKIIRWLLGE